ncbi:hypothetical protein WISP_55841 [Willisornis vidua]|uniref:Uncharacterized protein n=1 Tax=Willisornis vidua TaxID=1566151 RepID=A0ABQ9DC67_9PASS|nr:hypothetical protein WISP_55841 [Willisornis vidua]
MDSHPAALSRGCVFPAAAFAGPHRKGSSRRLPPGATHNRSSYFILNVVQSASTAIRVLSGDVAPNLCSLLQPGIICSSLSFDTDLQYALVLSLPATTQIVIGCVTVHDAVMDYMDRTWLMMKFDHRIIESVGLEESYKIIKSNP